MAVLVEAISVVVRRAAIERIFPGGWEEFVRRVPNRTFCSDEDLARVGFMTPVDVQAYVSTPEAGGLAFEKSGQAADFAVVDQLQGPTIPAPWLEFREIDANGMKLRACWLAGATPDQLALPQGWKYEGSMSAKPGFVANNTVDDRLKFLRRDGSLDVYLDLRTGKEVFLGRSTFDGESGPELATQLEAIFHEALKIEGKMQPLQALRDEKGLAPLFQQLNEELLPKARRIADGAGQQMAIAHFTVGLILRILRRREEAEQAFRKANELQPGAINILRELVRCLGEQNKNDEALVFAQEGANVAPTDAGAWGNLAMCWIRCGNRGEARKAIDYAIDLDPKDPINRYIRDNFEGYFKK